MTRPFLIFGLLSYLVSESTTQRVGQTDSFEDIDFPTSDLDDDAEIECYSGTGRDCLTVAKIVVIAFAISAGVALLVGGILLWIVMRTRRYGHGFRLYRVVASYCCCEPPLDDESLLDATGDHEESVIGQPSGVEVGKENAKGNATEVSDDNHQQQKPLLSPSKIKEEPVSPPKPDNGEVVDSSDLKEVKSEEPISPPVAQTYAQAVKTPPQNTSNSSAGGFDATDTSTPAGNKRKTSGFAALFNNPFKSKPSSPAPAAAAAAATNSSHNASKDFLLVEPIVRRKKVYLHLIAGDIDPLVEEPVTPITPSPLAGPTRKLTLEKQPMPAPDPAAPSGDNKPSGAEKNVTKDSSVLENSKNKSAADESSSSTPSRPGNDSADSGGSGASETPGKPNISRRSRISVLFRSFLSTTTADQTDDSEATDTKTPA